MTSFRKNVGVQNLKALGRTIGNARRSNLSSDIDGDGDGFVTGPDGQDNIPAPIAKASESIKKIWDDQAKKQLAADEKRAVKAAQSAKKKPPRFKLEQVADVMTRARRREEVSEAKAVAKGFIKSIFEIDGLGDDGEHKSRVTSVMFMGDKFKGFDGPHPEMHIVVEGDIRDKDGKSVGLFRREIYMDSENRKGKPYVYHDMLRVTEGSKGRGIGSDFTLATEAKYGELDMGEIYLNAGLTDGAYTWARAGYTFVNDDERKRFIAELRKRLKNFEQDAGNIDNLIAGGFETDVGRILVRRRDEEIKPRVTATSLFNNKEEYETFVSLVDEVEKGNAEPAVLTAFPKFAREIMFGMNVDMKKPIRKITEGKALFISGFDKILGRV